MPARLVALGEQVTVCTACPRLAGYLREARARYPGYWCRPVPGIGDAGARLLVVGLAPGFHGANRSGRPFCTDASGRWLWRALYLAGATSSEEAPLTADDLPGVYVTNALRCVPPQNRPTAAELATCRPYLGAELALLPEVRVILALGRLAHDSCVRLVDREGHGTRPIFSHGAMHRSEAWLLVASYHPSRQNTQTGRLTWPMFQDAVAKAVALSGLACAPSG
jgi:uracil-DNA glycosylase family 4